MSRIRCGAFLAPHHPVGEDPTLMMERDLELGVHLDRLGFDEYWVGEHHSSGWETIGSPEMFLAALAVQTRRIKLATGVISLPYHNPFTVAGRMVLLDHLSRGRAIFGSGPGALVSDAVMQGIDPMVQRDRQDEALGCILRLLRGETVSAETEWFTLKDARLQILPYQDDMECAVANGISPSGMKLAGKHGLGVISVASASADGLVALPTQWSFAEEAAQQHGQSVDRRNWRVMISFHLAETREQAVAEAAKGLQRWNNEYQLQVLARPGAFHVADAEEYASRLVPSVSEGDIQVGAGSGLVGTPEDLVRYIRELQDFVGGFGVVIGFAHDWANREATLRSWELCARYVIPEINGTTRPLKTSAQWLADDGGQMMGQAIQAIMAQVQKDPRAMEAMAVTLAQGGNEGSIEEAVGRVAAGPAGATAVDARA